MITTRKLNIMKVNSEVRLMRIKAWRVKQEEDDTAPQLPPQNLGVMQHQNGGAEAQMGIPMESAK